MVAEDLLHRFFNSLRPIHHTKQPPLHKLHQKTSNGFGNIGCDFHKPQKGPRSVCGDIGTDQDAFVLDGGCVKHQHHICVLGHIAFLHVFNRLCAVVLEGMADRGHSSQTLGKFAAHLVIIPQVASQKDLLCQLPGLLLG